MYKKFNRNTDLTPMKQLKSSQLKHIKSDISKQFPGIPIDVIFPPKTAVFTANWFVQFSSWSKSINAH